MEYASGSRGWWQLDRAGTPRGQGASGAPGEERQTPVRSDLNGHALLQQVRQSARLANSQNSAEPPEEAEPPGPPRRAPAGGGWS